MGIFLMGLVTVQAWESPHILSSCGDVNTHLHSGPPAVQTTFRPKELQNVSLEKKMAQ